MCGCTRACLFDIQWFGLHCLGNYLLFYYFKGQKLLHHDHVFWFGDFNYRIDLTNEEVKDFVHQRNWTKMQLADQLNIQRQMGNVRMADFVFY